MIAEGLKFLVDILRKSDAPIKLASPDPREAIYAIGGRVEHIEHSLAPRGHHPATLADVVSLANRFAEAGSRPVVWYGGDAVTLVIDDDGHRVETATLALATSDVWARLESLRAQKPAMQPKAFVRMLRVDLAGTLDPAALLNHVRRLKFTTADTVNASVARGKESMGREINSEVATAADIPETVTLAAPVFKTPGETDRYPVRCAVEIDPMEGTLQLLPLPDELERVERMALESIAARLSEGLSEGIPFYAGKP
jgi:hypothetical protein